MFSDSGQAVYCAQHESEHGQDEKQPRVKWQRNNYYKSSEKLQTNPCAFNLLKVDFVHFSFSYTLAVYLNTGNNSNNFSSNKLALAEI